MGKDLETRLAALSPDRIKALVRKVGRTPSGPQKMPRNPGQRYPLSSAQERMWFLVELSPESRVFNNPAAFRARTTRPLDYRLIERSLNEVGRRHEIMRTTFHVEDDRPVQVIHDEIPLRVTWEDLRPVPADRRDGKMARIAIAEGRQIFDLTTGPLITIKLVCLDDIEYLRLITSHHIVSDGWSNMIFDRVLAFLSVLWMLPERKAYRFRSPNGLNTNSG